MSNMSDLISREASKEIQTLRAKVEVLVEALQYLKEHRLWVNSHAKAIIESALATYDKLSETNMEVGDD